MSNNKETAKHALLKELADVQSLLDDADGPTQPPLLKPSADTTGPDAYQIRSWPANEANPFCRSPAPLSPGNRHRCVPHRPHKRRRHARH